MKLYIHFGIYKTGSSFLQYLCAKNRENLVKKNIFFPTSNQDQKMLAGKISSGNGYELSQALKHGQRKRVIDLLKNWIDAAKKNNCESILITAEDLIHQFARPECLQMLEDCLMENDIEQTEALGYIRDFSGHALSTFKHRAKTGKITNFPYWIENVYETPQVLNDFYTNHANCSIVWTIRKFKKNTGFMVDTFFKEWLDVMINDNIEKASVNASIELSEIILMQELYKLYPRMSDFFLADLKALPKDKRPHSDELEIAYREKAKTVLSTKNHIIDKINTMLPSNEKLPTYEHPETPVYFNEIAAYLSADQLSAMVSRIKKFKTPSGKFAILKRRIGGLLPRKITKKIVKRH